MFTFLVMLLDVSALLILAVFLVQCIRAVIMRALLVHKLKKICGSQNYQIQKHRWLFLSILFKSSKVDLSIHTGDQVYHVRFLASLSSKKVFHFVDEYNYISYLKTFTALPMATKVSEQINFAMFHRLPVGERKLPTSSNDTYVLLFNPTPNNITSVVDGTTTEIGNGTKIGTLVAYNGKGFCDMLKNNNGC